MTDRMELALKRGAADAYYGKRAPVPHIWLDRSRQRNRLHAAYDRRRTQSLLERL